ncbi:MAG TPA: heme-copper oxidase subunit III [Bacteroidia bacterium]|jgi:cytochrome c oxidase subunit 3|nr:heme-copper oxidase subunit III [Bacteroidia bacterium]
MEINYTIDKKVNEKAKKGLLYWSLASMTIFFGGFCSYYMVMHGNGNWLVFDLPALFFISTALIILSSFTMVWAQKAIKTDDYRSSQTGVLLTFLLGIGFAVCQVMAWKTLFASGIVFSGKHSNVSGSILYVITFMHFLHILAGLTALSVSLFKVTKKRYSSQNYLGLSLTAIFWHFLDTLWVILFLFLYLIR